MTNLYDKTKVKEALTLENIYELLEVFGGNPEYTNFGIVSSTICHNPPGEGSRKLYYYANSGLFNCYSGCEEPSFDIFQLVIKVMLIQKNKTYNLNDSVKYISYYFGISGEIQIEEKQLEDWKLFKDYDRIQSIEIKDYSIVLKEYDDSILDKLNYTVKIGPWLDEGITQEVLEKLRIGYYPSGQQITIPHYDINNRFIGLRGRTLGEEEALLYGKYRPVIANGIQYSHPLGMNLYNINNSKDNIKRMKTAIVFESEKSCMKYQSLFGFNNDISVACCGSNLSIQQVNILMELGVKEIVIAFDRQFQQSGDEEFISWTKKLTKIHDKYKNYITVSILFDKKGLLDYKESPIDKDKETFIQLYKERIFL